MFGLEKKKKELFEFDLEKELKSSPAKIKELLKTTEEKISSLKAALRQGAGSEDFDKLGVLLHGYTALQRVVNRIARTAKKK